MLTGKGSHASSCLKSKALESNLGLGPNLGLSPCSPPLVVTDSPALDSVSVTLTVHLPVHLE